MIVEVARGVRSRALFGGKRLQGEFAMPFNIGITELIIVLVIVMIIFGVGRLTEIGGALGKSIREFRSASTDETDGGAAEARTYRPSRSDESEKETEDRRA